MKTFFFFTLAIALGSASCSANVQRLSLRDPRLPAEARRWLADTEDEVAVARARVDDAANQLRIVQDYRNELREARPFSDKNEKHAASAGQAMNDYADKRMRLMSLSMEAAQMNLELALMRLTQVRAETAIRYDLRVYEMEPIVEQVNDLKSKVGEIQTRVETLRAEVETAADKLWNTYGKYVRSGGKTNAFWGLRSTGGS